MLRHIRFVTVVLALAALTASAQVIPIPAKRALTHEVMWLMKRVAAPSPSPDGKWTVFSVTNPAYEEKDQTSDLWIVPNDGSADPRQITFTKSSESDVAWSPDSKRIAFSAKREGDEAAQIYALDIVDGGEARRVTSIAGGARLPQFRPDGKAILFVSTPAEKKDVKYRVRIYESFPIRQWDRWLDETHPHLFVMLLDGKSQPVDILAGTQLIASPGFSGRFGEGSREDLDALWSPDGTSIVFAASTNRNTAAYAETSSDLYQVGTKGGEEPKVIARDAGSYARPKFSPDGKALFAVFNANNGKVYNLDRLVRFDWPSMQNRKVITATSDRSVGSYAVTPFSDAIYFTAEDAGLEKIYVVPAAGGEVELTVDPKQGVYTNLAISEKAPVMVALWGSSINPAEVVRIDAPNGRHLPLSEFNVATAHNIDWLPPRHFWFTSKRGKKIHNMVFLPPAFDPTKKYPLLVFMHGGAANMSRDQISLRWNYHLLAKPGYVVLTTNYTGSTGFGETFAQDIQGDPLKGPGDEINQAADEAVKQFPFIDGTRMAAAGASYGGHLANWLEATTTRYKCLISHAGLVDLESQWGTSDTIYGRELMNLGPPWEQGKVWREQNPAHLAADFKTPMLLSVGEHDFRVPMNNTLQNWALLQRRRVPSRLLVWPDENHWILNAENSRHFYQEIWDWLARWL